MKPSSIISFGLALLGCAHAPAPSLPAPPLDSALRFRNVPVITRLTDQPIAQPSARPFDREAYWYDAYLGRRSVRALEVRRPARAANVNALDEVPDSAWFENRIGVRALTVEEIRRGPTPPPRPPFSVVGTKLGGVTPGLRVRDSIGTGYLLKFDRPDDPISETASDVVVQRLLWAVGYHTPDDMIITFAGEDLRLAPEARLKDTRGEQRAMTEADLRKVLAGVGRQADGRYRGLLSKLVPGVPLGGYSQEGKRADDANDPVPHEERRDVRGARVFFAWLNHTDLKEDNLLDTWIPDPRSPGRGHVRHHLVDFGNSLGVFGWRQDRTSGFSENLDLGYGVRSLVALGLWQRPWETISASPLQGVGNLESAVFDAAGWRPAYPWAPFDRFDRFDGFWAARILMRVNPDLVAAAVAEGHYDDPRSAAYVAATLVERQRKLGRHYLAQTSALDDFMVDESDRGVSLCFQDLLIAHFGAAEPALVAGTAHRISTWDFAGRPLAFTALRPGAVRSCVDGFPPGPGPDHYTIVAVDTVRDGAPAQRVLLHLARDPSSGRMRLIGVRRV
jgi:hypothetical protein